MLVIIIVLSLVLVVRIADAYRRAISRKVYLVEIERKIRLEVLAAISATDETIAYRFRDSEDPDVRKFAEALMDTAIQAKKVIRANSTGLERKAYLKRAEGHYIKPKGTV